MAREIRIDQNYYDKLLKLIPSEIVAAYLIITGKITKKIKIFLTARGRTRTL